MEHPKIAFIGAGNMAKAIIVGLIESGYPRENITATATGIDKLNLLHNEYEIAVTTDNSIAAMNSDIIVLAVKPPIIERVCNEIASSVGDKLIISVAAGQTCSSIRSYLSTEKLSNASIIRAMPNTPCLLSKGAVGLFATDSVSDSEHEFVTKLFSNIGKIFWLEIENHIDIVTAVSGSGPAFYFYMAEAMTNAAIQMGLDASISRELVNQTAFGAAAMLNEFDMETAAQLRKKVTSPKGTTEAAMNVFDDAGLMNIINDAVSAGATRAVELSKND